MADLSTSSYNQQERVGRKRFESGIEFEKIVLNLARTIQDRLLQNLPSNYPQDPNTNLAEIFRAISEEFARLQSSISDVNEDQYHVSIKAEYLYQILGDTLFLDNKAINYNISDAAYRDFLINVRNAYYGGSRKDNIEQSVSDILGIPVTIKELYLDLREENTSVTIKDTHKMFCDILMDYVSSTSVGLLLENLKFFLDLIKPAHTLYDTRLIWTDTIQTQNNACTPVYAETGALSEIIYGVDKIDMVTSVDDRLYRITGAYIDPKESWTTGIVSSIDETKGILYLEDKTILVCTDTSKLYERAYEDAGVTGFYTASDSTILLGSLNPGDDIFYYATQDGPNSSSVITSDWLYTGIVGLTAGIDTSNETITLTSGQILVYNKDVLVYTRDKNGEYRIFVSGLTGGQEIAFRGTEYSQLLQFYNVPEAVKENPYKQFDPEVMETPYFQGNVKKVLETREEGLTGLSVGPHVIVEDGIVKVVDVESKFYKRENSVACKPFKVHRYNLFIDEVFKDQFSIEEPDPEITEDEALLVFGNMPGESGLGLTGLNYNITINETSQLEETSEEPTVQSIGVTGHTEMCDRKAECQLVPYYEDTRKYYDFPDIQLTSGFITTVILPVPYGVTGLELPAYFTISNDPNSYVMPCLPILNSDGEPAEPEDLIVYINGLQVLDAVNSVKPWTGEVDLNFLPPANSKVRVDYYYSNRYPAPQTYIEHVGQTLSSQRLQWPYPIVETGLYGNSQDFQVDKYPILNQRGQLANPCDIMTSIGSLDVTGNIIGVTGCGITGLDKSVLISDSSVTGIHAGDTLVIDAESYFNTTLIYTTTGIIGYNYIVLNKNFGVPIDPAGFPYESVSFTGAPTGTVECVRPILGHIHLTGAPALGSFVKFDYYYNVYNRTYTFVPDVGVTGPYMNQGYASDTFYGNYNGFTLVPDEGFTGYQNPIFDYNQVEKIGYRYRVFNLSNSSVLNSKDTLVLDGYYRNSGEASWANNHNKLNQYNLLFSPEYLTDQDQNVILNDKYLEKNLDPVTKLYPGSVPFVATFTDDGRFRNNTYPESTSTYIEPTVTTHDISAGFTIVGADDSGLIDYKPICEYEKNRKIKLYSALKIVEQDFEGFDGPLSTISEGQRTIPFSVTYIDQYYPSRELRLNDYLDYINRVPEEGATGVLRIMRNSKVAKRVKGIWRNLKIGDMFNVNTSPYTHYYTVIERIDSDTVLFSTNFKEASGEYIYNLYRDTVYQTDVSLDEVTRELVLNGISDPSYGLTGFPGNGDTGINFGIHFPDPSLSAHPRSPYNPNITGLPTGDRFLLLVTGPPASSLTGPRYVPLTREIIDADGNTVYYTGMLSGYTGPSGALNLGLTGPTRDNNPRTLEGDDKYFIPSGDSGIFWAYSESEYRVNWRNWDQAIMIIHGSSGMAGLTGPDKLWVQGITGSPEWGIKII
jgi:hypothetical protein